MQQLLDKKDDLSNQMDVCEQLGRSIRICVQEKLKYAIKNKTVDIIVNKFQVYYPCRNRVLFINMYMNDFVIGVCS